jgi:hypothetical protein
MFGPTVAWLLLIWTQIGPLRRAVVAGASRSGYPTV